MTSSTSPLLDPRPRDEATLAAFTRRGAGPSATLPLVLAAVTVAALSMSMDAVQRYSPAAFMAGLGLTVVLAFVVAKVVDALKGHGGLRLTATVLLPTASGALIGMIVQAIVLSDVGWMWAVKDLGGLVDTTQPTLWIASGIVLGGLPALLVSAFLLLAGRALRRLTGHDASEGFGVVFTGSTGVVAGIGLNYVDDFALPALFIVAMTSSLTLLVVLLVDGARLRFLRRVYSGADGDFDIVPAEQFAGDASLVPMVTLPNARSSAVLLRGHRAGGSYRTAAEPIALLGETELETLQPLLRRRAATLALFAATVLLLVLATLSHT